jgi:hypothetical protein
MSARGTKGVAMPLRSYSGYSDVNWFVRVLRAVPVIAGAALLGAIIGGFAMFAIDSALGPAQRLDARADNQTTAQTSAQATAVEQRASKPVRIVGGAIPDPSAGMSGPPPAPPPAPQPSSVPAQPQISSELLAPKALGPPTPLQPQTVTATGAAQTQNQPGNQAIHQPAAQMQNAAAPQQQPTRPDALSRAHQNAPNVQDQNPAPPAAAQTTTGVNTSSETESKAADSKPAVSSEDQDRSARSRHSRRRTTFGANDFSTTPPSRRQNVQSYDRLYDYYGNRRDRPYGYRREQPYGGGFDEGRALAPYRGGGFYRGGGGYQPGDY